MAPPVIEAINQTVDNGRVRLAMMMGSYMEGGWGPNYDVGDGGTSFGPYQMHRGGALTSSGLTPAQAEDPVTATRAMLGAYEAAVAAVPDSLWTSDPKHAAALAAFKAERPTQMYPQGRINDAWNATVGGLSTTTIKQIVSFPLRIPSDVKGLLGKGAKAAGGAAVDVASSAAQGVVNSLWDTVLAKALFVTLALGVGVLGAYQLFKPQIRQAQNRAAELGGIAAKAGV